MSGHHPCPCGKMTDDDCACDDVTRHLLQNARRNDDNPGVQVTIPEPTVGQPEQ